MSMPLAWTRMLLSSGGLELGDGKGQPLAAGVLEIDLDAGVAAGALGAHDDARTELGVMDVLADAEAAVAAARRGRRRAPVGRPGLGRVAGLLQLRRQPLEQAGRDLFEEARLDVVAGLAVEHPRLGEGQVEPLPGP